VPKRKNLPSASDLKEKFRDTSVPGFLRADPEVSKWLHKVFSWKDTGEISLGFIDIATELSEFSDTAITGDHISRAYNRWKRTGNL